MPQLTNLTTNVIADTTNFVSGLKRADKALADSKRSVQNTLAGIDQSFAGLGKSVDNLVSGFGFAKTAVAGIFAGAAAIQIKSYIGSVFDAVSGLGELSDQLGIDVEYLQAYQYAAGQSGASSDELNAAIQRLSRTIGDAVDGDQTAQDLFSKLGIRFKDTAGNARSTADVLRDVAERIKATGSAAQQGAIAYDVFGKSGQKLIPMLKDGAAGMDEWKQKASDMGLIMSRQLVDDFDAAADKWEEWGKRVTVVSAKVIDFMLTNAQKNNQAFSDFWSTVFGGGTDVKSLQTQLQQKRNALQMIDDMHKAAKAAPPDASSALSLYTEDAYQADLKRINGEISAIERAIGLAKEPRTKDDTYLPDANDIKTRPAAVKTVKALTSALAEFNKTQTDELSLAKLTNREREITIDVMKAQAAAQKDYDAGLRASPLLSETELQTVKDHAAALYDYAEAQRQTLEWTKDAGAAIEDNTDATDKWQQSAIDATQAIGTSFEDAVIQGGNLRDVLQGILDDIERIILREAVTKPLENLVSDGLNWLSGLLGGGGAGGFLSGGGKRGFAQGGLISGPGGPRSDNILAAVSDGEFVVNAAATRNNLSLLTALNANRIPHFADGGMVGAAQSADLIRHSDIGSGGGITLNAPITINANGGTPQQNQDLANQIGRTLVPQLRQMMQGEIQTQLRAGGMLNRGYGGA